MIEPSPHFLRDIALEINSLRDPGCDQFLTATGLRRMFLLFTRGHWSDSRNHGLGYEDSLKCLHWNPDPAERTLDVELHGTDGANNAGEQAIFVNVGGFRFKHPTFGARSGFEKDNATDYFAALVHGQVLFRHRARSLDQAYDMAWSTLCFYEGYREAVLATMGSEASIHPEVLGEPSLKEPAPAAIYQVDMGMRLEVNLVVGTSVVSHRLKRVFDEISSAY